MDEMECCLDMLKILIEHDMMSVEVLLLISFSKQCL